MAARVGVLVRAGAAVGLVVAVAGGLVGASRGESLAPGGALSSGADASVAAGWDEAVAIETMMFDEPDLTNDEMMAALLRAASLFERAAEAPAGRPDGYWRASRATWLAGELLPLEDTEGRMARFEAGLALADRGLAVDPECAECMLWKFTAMGRLRTTSGVFEGLRQVKDMADLLDRGIDLEPTYRDNDLNSTLGNLHYASAVYYRILPDWFWVRWVIGVRGDKERALEHSRAALALHPTRFDYKIELGTQLLCLGSAKRKDRERLDEGRAVLEEAIAEVPANDDERREVFFVRQLLEAPEKACGYTGDGVLEIDEDAAREAKSSV